jgi:hypothetical protein
MLTVSPTFNVSRFHPARVMLFGLTVSNSQETIPPFSMASRCLRALPRAVPHRGKGHPAQIPHAAARVLHYGHRRPVPGGPSLALRGSRRARSLPGGNEGRSGVAGLSEKVRPLFAHTRRGSGGRCRGRRYRHHLRQGGVDDRRRDPRRKGGDAVHIPPNTVHSVKVVGNERCTG